MSERDGLPHGYEIFIGIMGDSYLALPNGQKLLFRTQAEAIASAWHIVDAEKEAADGR